MCKAKPVVSVREDGCNDVAEESVLLKHGWIKKFKGICNRQLQTVKTLLSSILLELIPVCDPKWYFLADGDQQLQVKHEAQDLQGSQA